MAQSKLELILEWKNKATAGISKMKKQVKGELSDLDNGISRFKTRAAGAFSAVKDEVPGLARGLEIISNKYVLMAASAVALGVASIKLGTHLADIERQVSGSQKNVQAIFGITGEGLKDVTAEVRAVSKALNVDENEFSKAANTLQREYADAGMSVSDSLKLVRTGLQATNGQLEIRQIQEYATQMKAAGLSAEEFISLAASQTQNGIFDDKGVDAVKEFNLRLKEMTPAAKDALKNIGLSGDSIMKGLNDGSLRTMDVLKQVSLAMGTANVQARQTAIADLFGGAGEDAGERFLLSLGKMDLSIKGITAGMEDQISHSNQLIDANQRIETQWATIAEAIKPARQQFDLLKLKAQEVFYKTIANVITWFKANWPVIETGLKIVTYSILGIGAAFIGLQVPMALTWAAATIGAAKATVASFTFAGSIRAIGAAIYKIPIIGWIALAITGFITLYQTVDTFRASINGIVASFMELLKLAKPLGMIMAGIGTGNYGMISQGVSELKSAWKDMDMKGAFNNAYDSTMSEAKKKAGTSLLTDSTVADDGSGTTPAGTDPAAVVPTTTPSMMEGGSSGQVRNVTISIDSFVKGGVNVVRQGDPDSMTEQDLEQWFRDMMMRVVRNTELSAG